MEITGSGSASEIYSKIKSKFLSLQTSGKLNFISSCEFNDSTCSAAIKGTGFDAKIRCEDGKVIADVSLGLLLRAMKGKIEDGLRKRLEEAIN